MLTALLARIAQAHRSDASWTPLLLFTGGARGGWWDPSDLSTLFQDTAGTVPVTAPGQAVALFRDKSGNGNDLTQTSPAARPVLQNDGINNYLQFSGNQYLLRAANIALAPQTDSWFSVAGAKFDDGLAGRSIYARSLAGASGGRYSNHRTGSGTLIAFYDGPNNGGVQVGPNDTNISKRIVAATVDRVNGKVDERFDALSVGNLAFTPDSGTSRTSAFRFLMGAYNDSSDTGIINPMNGRIYGLVLCFGEAINSNNRALAEVWMSDRCGVPLRDDPYWGSVLSLLHFNGNGIDEKSVVAWSAVGAPNYSSPGKFGNGFTPSATDYPFIDAAYKSALTFLHSTDTSWTVDVWFKPTSLSGTQTFIANNGGATANIGIMLMLNNGSPRIQVTRGVSGSPVVDFTAPSALTLNAQSLLSFKFDAQANLYKISINGVLVDSSAPSAVGTATVATNALTVGRNSSGTAFVALGVMDDLRITKGVARPDSAPPSSQFPSVS